jgi:hypothetical protein
LPGAGSGPGLRNARRWLRLLLVLALLSLLLGIEVVILVLAMIAMSPALLCSSVIARGEQSGERWQGGQCSKQTTAGVAGREGA